MIHLIYKISDPDTGEYYIGKHSCEKIDDGYVGSGNWSKKITKEKRTIVKEIISFHENSETAYEAEKRLIGDLWKTDRFCRNEIPGGNQSFFEPEFYSSYCLEKYGVEHHMLLEEYRKNVVGFRNDETQKKADVTLRTKYNGRGSGSEQIKEKVKSTNVKKYGTNHTLHLDSVKESRENGSLKKYGTTNPFFSRELQSSFVNPMSVPEHREKHKKAMENKDWTERNAKSKQTKLLNSQKIK